MNEIEKRFLDAMLVIVHLIGDGERCKKPADL